MWYTAHRPYFCLQSEMTSMHSQNQAENELNAKICVCCQQSKAKNALIM